MDDKDVKDFASNLQKSIGDGLLPTQNQINDVTKQISENLSSGEIDSAINIVGSDKVKELSTHLTASASMYEKIKTEAMSVTHELVKANTESELEEKIKQQTASLNQRIANTQSAITESQNKLMPNLESELATAQTKLSLMDKLDTGYTDQLNKVKEIGTSIEQEKLRVADIIGQQAGLTKLKDEELAKASELLGKNKSIYDMRMEITKNSRELLESTKEQLDATEKLERVLERLGDNFKKLLENNKDVIKEFHSEIDNMSSGITNTIKKIPLVGGILASSVQKPLESATNKVKEDFTAGFLKMAEVAGKPGATLADSLKAGSTEMMGAIKGIGSMLTSVLTGPVLIIGSIVALLALAFSRFQALEKSTQEFRNELGLSYGAMEQIQKDAISVNKELAYFGVSIEEAVGSAKALVEEFGNVNHVTRGQIELVSKLSAGLGISQDAAAGALVKFMEMGAPSDEVAQNLTLATAELSNLAGVPAGKVMEDVANASEDAILAIGNMPRNLAAAAVEARRMGSSLDSAAATASHLLDFESSISSEMKLASMMGRHVNFQKMRQLAMDGDLAGMQKEQLRIMKEMGGFDRMNRFQKQALAEALGTSVEELTKMNKIEKENAEFARENPELAAEYQKQLEALRGGEEKSLAQQAEARMKQEIQQAKMNALQNQFNQMMVEMGEALLPVINGLMSALVPILKVIGFLLKLIVAPFALIGDLIAAITGDTSRLKERFSDFGSTAITIVGSLGVALVVAMKMGSTSMTGLFSSFGDMIKGALKKVAGLGSAIKTAFSAGGATSAASAIPAPSGVGAFGRGSPIQSATPKPSVAANKGPGFADKFAEIDTNGLLKAAGALAILAGALYVSAKAFQEFGEVTWEGVVKGLVAIGSLVLVSKLLSKGSDDMMKGAATVAILGASLIPAAFAFQMFANVPFSAVILGIAALSALAVVAAVVGKFSPVIYAGAGALAAIAGGMLVFGLAAMAFAMAVNIIASAFGKVIETIQSMSMGDIGMIYALGSAFAFIGLMSPLLILAAVSIGILGLALIPFSIGLLAAGVGLTMFAFGVKQLIDHSSELPAAAFNFGIFIGMMAMLAPTLAIAGLGLAAFGIALIPFGIGIALAGAGVALFGFGMSMVMDTMKDLPQAAASLMLFAGAMALIAPLTPFILLTAGAFAILGVALIPLAVAMLAFGAGVALVGLGFQMLSDANAPELLINLGMAISLVGLMLPFIVLGAVAIGIMTAALIPFSAALLVAGVGMSLFGLGLSLTADALNQITGESIANLFGIALAVAALGPLLPFIALGAVSLTIMSGSLLTFGAAVMVVGLGLEVLGGGLESTVGYLKQLGEMAGQIGAAAIAIYAVSGALASLAFAQVGQAVGGLASSFVNFGSDMVNAVNPFRDASEEAAKGPFDEILKLAPYAKDFEGLGMGIEKLAIGTTVLSKIDTDALDAVSESIRNLRRAFSGEEEASILGSLKNTASGFIDSLNPMKDAEAMPMDDMFGPLTELFAFADQAFMLGVGLEAVANGLSQISNVDIAPIQQLSTVLPELMSSILGNAPAAKEPEGFASSLFSGFTGMFGGDDDEEKPEAAAGGGGAEMSQAPLKKMVDQLNEFASISDETLGVLDLISYSMARLAMALTMINMEQVETITSLGESFSQIGRILPSVQRGTSALKMVADSVTDVEDSMQSAGPHLKVLTDSLKKLSDMNITADVGDDLGDGLEDLGEGLEDFVDYMVDADLDTMSKTLPSNLEAIGKALSSFGSIQINPDLGDQLEDFGEGLEDFIDYMADADLATISDSLSVNLKTLGSAISSFSTLNINSELGDILEDFGEGLEDFIDYMDDADLATISASLSTNLTALGNALSGFANLNISSDLGDQLDDFGEGLEDFIDYMNDADLATVSVSLSANLTALGDALRGFANLNISSDLGDQLDDFGEGLEDFIDYMDDADLATVSVSLSKNLTDLGNALKTFSTLNIQSDIGDKLEDFGEGLEDFIDYMDDADLAEVSASLSKNLTDLGNALKTFSTLNIQSDIGDKLEDFGEGLEDFIDYMDDADLATVSASLASNLSALGNALNTFSTLNIQSDIGDKLEDFGEGLEDFIDYMSDADLAEVSGALASNLSDLGNALNTFSTLNIQSDIGDKLEDFGEGLEDFIDYMDDADLAKVSSSLGKNLSNLGSALTKFSSLNIKSNIGDTLEDFGAGLEEFIDYLDDDELSVVTDQFSSQMMSLGKAISSLSGLNISEGFGATVENLGKGIEQFLDYLNDDEMETMTQTFSSQMLSLSTALKSLSGIQITEQFGENLQSLGHGIEEFLDYLNDDEMETMTGTFVNQMALLSDALVSLSGISISSNFGNTLTSLGKGVEQFSDYLNDGEGKDIGNFFRSAGSSLVRFVEGVSKIANVKEISLTTSLRDLSEVAKGIDPSAVSNIELLGVKLTESLSAFANVDDPIIQTLKDINAELYSLCENINNLNIEKIEALKQMGTGIGGSSEGGGFLPPNVNSEADMIRMGIGDGSPDIMPSQTSSIATTTTNTSSLGESFANLTDDFEKPEVDKKYELFKRAHSDVSMEDLQSYIGTNKSLIESSEEKRRRGEPTYLDVNKFQMENDYMERMMQEKAQEQFQSYENIQVPEKPLNVFDWKQDENGNVDFGDPGMMSISPQVAPGEAFNPFSVAETDEGNEELQTGIQIEQLAQSVDTTIPPSASTIMTESSPSNVVDTREVADGAIEKKLSELIALMKSGGIAVNLDGKKVSTAIAKVQPD